MKRLLISLFVLSLFTACNSTGTNSTTTSAATGTAQIKFDTDAFDFGKINEGDKITHEFKFLNTGKAPLIITKAEATCGCTTPEWPHTPVKPGGSGIIKVTFSSVGKSGLQDKQITVTANTTPANSVVHLVGEVLEKKK